MTESLLLQVQESCKFLTKLRPDAKKFYSLFFAKIVQKSAVYFPDLRPKVSTLFATKLANATLHHCVTSAKEQPEAVTIFFYDQQTCFRKGNGWPAVLRRICLQQSL